MKSIFNRKKNSTAILRDERGLSTVEYVILLALIAVGGIAAWTSFGGKLRDKLSDQEKAIDNMSIGTK